MLPEVSGKCPRFTSSCLTCTCRGLQFKKIKSASCKLLFITSLGDADTADFRNKLLGNYTSVSVVGASVRSKSVIITASFLFVCCV